jgi:hypothetical protein
MFLVFLFVCVIYYVLSSGFDSMTLVLDLNLTFSLFTRKFAGLKLNRKLGFVFVWTEQKDQTNFILSIFFLFS